MPRCNWLKVGQLIRIEIIIRPCQSFKEYTPMLDEASSQWMLQISQTPPTFTNREYEITQIAAIFAVPPSSLLRATTGHRNCGEDRLDHVDILGCQSI